jgi:hypothetical protein
MIWDVFTYHNEQALSLLRSMELAALGVTAVPVEASCTFTGEPRARVLPGSYFCGLRGSRAVEREDSARRACRNALRWRGARPGDTVIFGDVDEIPMADAVLLALESDNGPRRLPMPYHSLLITWRLPLDRDVWNFRWPVIGSLEDLDKACKGDWARLRAASGVLPPLEGIGDCGWHLSSMGGPKLVLDKIASFAHAGEEWSYGIDAERLRDLARRGRDVADRFDMEAVALAEMPWAIRDHPASWIDFLSTEAW